MPYKKFIKTSSFHNNKIYVPEKVRKILELENGDTIFWSSNVSGDIIISKNESNESSYPY